MDDCKYISISFLKREAMHVICSVLSCVVGRGCSESAPRTAFVASSGDSNTMCDTTSRPVLAYGFGKGFKGELMVGSTHGGR